MQPSGYNVTRRKQTIWAIILFTYLQKKTKKLFSVCLCQQRSPCIWQPFLPFLTLGFTVLLFSEARNHHIDIIVSEMWRMSLSPVKDLSHTVPLINFWPLNHQITEIASSFQLLADLCQWGSSSCSSHIHSAAAQNKHSGMEGVRVVLHNQLQWAAVQTAGITI